MTTSVDAHYSCRFCPLDPSREVRPPTCMMSSYNAIAASAQSFTANIPDFLCLPPMILVEIIFRPFLFFILPLPKERDRTKETRNETSVLSECRRGVGLF